MRHYSFTISRNGQPQSKSIAECSNDGSAKKEAAGMFADLAREISTQLDLVQDWQIDVSDAAGNVIFQIRVTAS